jgi:septal ring-binding cell division protein DamX
MRTFQNFTLKTQNCPAHFLLTCMFLGVLCFVIACPISAVAQRATKGYVEDLSAYRPKFEVKVDSSKRAFINKKDRSLMKPTKNVNSKLDAVLDSIDKQNLQKKFIDGYAIQIYSGQSKEEAIVIRQRVQEQLKDVNATLQYLQPKFRVTVGNYFSKLEAQKDLVRLKSYFSGAILVPEKIQIR